MIRINLANRKQQSVVSDGGKGMGGLDLRSVGENARDFIGDLPLGKYVAAVVVCGIAHYALGWHESAETQKLDAQIEQVVAEKEQLQAQLGKTRGYEELKRAMDSDEIMIKTKIDTIEKLIEGRQSSPSLLIALSSAMPPEVWLGDLTLKEGALGIKGNSTDYNYVSDFMRNLGESAYFMDINLSSSREARDETGQVIANFELSARQR